MKKFVFIIIVLFLVLGATGFSLAEEKIIVNFFFSPTCHNCADEKVFLEDLKQKYPDVEFKNYNVFEKQGIDFLKEMYQEYDVPTQEQGFVPITFIRDRYFLGFDEDTALDMENYILELIENSSQSEPLPDNRKIILPIIGEISLSNLSPLALAITLGALDGFNACAMIALGFLLTVLISTGIRKRVFLIGGTFILVSGIVYFLFISAWMNLFLVL